MSGCFYLYIGTVNILKHIENREQRFIPKIVDPKWVLNRQPLALLVRSSATGLPGLASQIDISKQVNKIDSIYIESQ